MRKSYCQIKKNYYFCTRKKRSDARVAEEARLESVCAPKAYRGFESRLLRKDFKYRCQPRLKSGVDN